MKLSECEECKCLELGAREACIWECMKGSADVGDSFHENQNFIDDI